MGSTYMTLIPTVKSYHTITLNNEWSVIKIKQKNEKKKSQFKENKTTTR
jgi:hypothetical protein